MADHFALMAGRLLTESTLQSAILEAFDVPSMKTVYDQPDPSVPEAVQDVRPKSGVMVECRICQEEGDQAYMETPCSCKGSLKYAHHICIQRWCNEKETPYVRYAYSNLHQTILPLSSCFGMEGTQLASGELDKDRRISILVTDKKTLRKPQITLLAHQALTLKVPIQKGVIYCRVVAIVLMALLVLRDAISLILGGPEVYSMALIILLMFRTAGIVIPIYIILISATTLLRRYKQHQAVHETADSEPGGAEGLQPMPPQHHIISIQ